MGIDYRGMLLVGMKVSELPEDAYEEWLEENDYDEDGDGDLRNEFFDERGLSKASPYYDCSIEYCTVGFELDDILLEDESYIELIEKRKDRFMAIFGVTPKLIGMQDIW